jgi:hypothetical protein
VNASLKKAAIAVTKNVEGPLTASLRDKAYKAEWPSDVIIQLNVKAKDGALYIDYPDELDERINNLEYGSEGVSPQAVLRPFMSRYASHMEEEFSNSVVDVLAEIGALG